MYKVEYGIQLLEGHYSGGIILLEHDPAVTCIILVVCTLVVLGPVFFFNQSHCVYMSVFSFCTCNKNKVVHRKTDDLGEPYVATHIRYIPPSGYSDAHLRSQRYYPWQYWRSPGGPFIARRGRTYRHKQSGGPLLGERLLHDHPVILGGLLEHDHPVILGGLLEYDFLSFLVIIKC